MSSVPKNQIKNSLWSIFKDENQLQHAVEQNANPALISKATSIGGYIVLVADTQAGLQQDEKLLFESLKDGEYKEDINEVHFINGTILNVGQVLLGQKPYVLKDVQVLFNQESGHSWYSFWQQNEATLEKCGLSDVIGKDGKVTRIEEVSPICSLRLIRPNEKIQQQIFRNSDYSIVYPISIFKDGGILEDKIVSFREVNTQFFVIVRNLV